MHLSDKQGERKEVERRKRKKKDRKGKKREEKKRKHEWNSVMDFLKTYIFQFISLHLHNKKNFRVNVPEIPPIDCQLSLSPYLYVPSLSSVYSAVAWYISK